MKTKPTKIAVIGGGSLLWSFGFVRQFVRSPMMKGGVVSLMDIDPDALQLTSTAARIHNRDQGSPLTVDATTDMDVTLKDADYVILCISTGGLDAMRHDLEIPERYGIWHTVGDTVGPGGWARAVRNIPVLYKIAERMSRLCPAAWLLNCTNPLSALTRVPHKFFGIKTIGMCPGIEEMARDLAILAGAKADSRREYIATGIDHGSFFTQLYADGMDVLAELRERGFCRTDGELPSAVTGNDAMMGAVSLRADFALWAQLGYMPGIGDRHTVENYPWFLLKPDQRLDFGIKRTNIEQRQARRVATRKKMEAYVANPNEETVRNLGHGDDPIGPVIEALDGRRSLLLGANYQNIGQIPQAPVGAVVETRCLFDAAGVHPLASPMPDVIKAIVLPTIWRQEAVIDITLHGTFDELVALVSTDPMCSRLKLGQCRQMVRELMEAHRPFITNPKLNQYEIK